MQSSERSDGRGKRTCERMGTEIEDIQWSERSDGKGKRSIEGIRRERESQYNEVRDPMEEGRGPVKELWSR
jgi:Lon protease-like protein